MEKKVAIVGIGTTGFRSTTPDLSYRELTYEAAVKAYMEAGVEPKDIDGFIATSEDFLEGYSISDEYSPDQLGAVLKPIHTVPGDFIQSLANGYMLILSGYARIVAIQAMSKASNMLTKGDLVTFATDPFTWRPLKETPHAIAAMEMNRFLYTTGNSKQQCAMVVVKNRRNAMKNPRAAYGCLLEIEDVLGSESVSYPLNRLEIAQHADGAVVCVLASADVARCMKTKPVWIAGIGWASEGYSLEHRNWDEAVYMRLAAKMAYKMAGITSPANQIDFAEVNDEYSYKELQHLEALMICGRGESGKLVETGFTEPDGKFPVNVSGGSLGCGHLFELDGGQKILETILQIRGEAGTYQLQKARVGLAASWRGVPTTTGCVAILSE